MSLCAAVLFINQMNGHPWATSSRQPSPIDAERDSFVFPKSSVSSPTDTSGPLSLIATPTSHIRAVSSFTRADEAEDGFIHRVLMKPSLSNLLIQKLHLPEFLCLKTSEDSVDLTPIIFKGTLLQTTSTADTAIRATETQSANGHRSTSYKVRTRLFFPEKNPKLAELVKGCSTVQPKFHRWHGGHFEQESTWEDIEESLKGLTGRILSMDNISSRTDDDVNESESILTFRLDSDGDLKPIRVEAAIKVYWYGFEFKDGTRLLHRRSVVMPCVVSVEPAEQTCSTAPGSFQTKSRGSSWNTTGLDKRMTALGCIPEDEEIA